MIDNANAVKEAHVCSAHFISFMLKSLTFTENCVSMHDVHTVNLCCLKLFRGHGYSFPYVLVEDILNMSRHDSYTHQGTYTRRLSHVFIYKIWVNISGHLLIFSTNLLWKLGYTDYPHRPVLFYVAIVPSPHWTTCIFGIIRQKTVGMHVVLLSAITFTNTKPQVHHDKLMNVQWQIHHINDGGIISLVLGESFCIYIYIYISELQDGHCIEKLLKNYVT